MQQAHSYLPRTFFPNISEQLLSYRRALTQIQQSQAKPPHSMEKYKPLNLLLRRSQSLCFIFVYIICQHLRELAIYSIHFVFIFYQLEYKVPKGKILIQHYIFSTKYKHESSSQLV